MRTSLIAISLTLLFSSAVSMGAEDYGSLKKQADDHYFIGKYDEAKAAYLNAKKVNEADPDLYFRLAQIEYRRGHPEDAIQILVRARELDPRNPDYHALLGMIHFTLGHYEQAIPGLMEALQLQPNYIMALEFLGLAYYQTGHMEEALKTYQTLSEKDPANFQAPLFLGQWLMEQGHGVQAKAEFQKTIAINGRYAPTYGWLAALEQQSGDWQDAITHWQEATHLDPANVYSWFSLGQLRFEHGQYDKALEALRRCWLLTRTTDRRSPIEMLLSSGSSMAGHQDQRYQAGPTRLRRSIGDRQAAIKARLL